MLNDITAARSQQIDNLFDAFNLDHKTSLRLDALDAYEIKNPKLLLDFTGALSSEEKDNDGKGTGTFSTVETFTVDAAGILYVGAIALSAPNLNLLVGQNVNGKVQDIQADNMQFSGPWFPFRKFAVTAGEQVVAVVEGKPDPGNDDQKKFTLRAYLFPTGPFWTADMALDARSDGMARQWFDGHLGWVDVGWRETGGPSEERRRDRRGENRRAHAHQRDGAAEALRRRFSRTGIFRRRQLGSGSEHRPERLPCRRNDGAGQRSHPTESLGQVRGIRRRRHDGQCDCHRAAGNGRDRAGLHGRPRRSGWSGSKAGGPDQHHDEAVSARQQRQSPNVPHLRPGWASQAGAAPRPRPRRSPTGGWASFPATA